MLFRLAWAESAGLVPFLRLLGELLHEALEAKFTKRLAIRLQRSAEDGTSSPDIVSCDCT